MSRIRVQAIAPWRAGIVLFALSLLPMGGLAIAAGGGEAKTDPGAGFESTPPSSTRRPLTNCRRPSRARRSSWSRDR